MLLGCFPESGGTASLLVLSTLNTYSPRKWDGLREGWVPALGSDFRSGSPLPKLILQLGAFLPVLAEEPVSGADSTHPALQVQGLSGTCLPEPCSPLLPTVPLGCYRQGSVLDCFLAVCVLFSPRCHHFFPQNKYLMLLLSLHLIKMYRICAVNSNETNKTRAPSLEGIRCE